METNKNTEQTQSTPNRYAFLNVQRYFFSKDGQRITLVLDGNTAVSLHMNFLKARLGIAYTATRFNAFVTAWKWARFSRANTLTGRCVLMMPGF